MKVAILSDIHGNQEALEQVVKSIPEDINGIILLGDLVDYGPHSNQVIEMIKSFQWPVLCNLKGNHENAILDDKYDRFSSERGVESAKYTASLLADTTWKYLKEEMSSEGALEFELDGKKCLAVHGSLQDEFWVAVKKTQDLSDYKKYDYVFSGHSHYPHFFEEFYECDNPLMRNKKKTIFINPGSVGQPRNHNPNAQYAILDTVTGTVIMQNIMYNIEKEQKAFSDEIDVFYKNRLEVGV